MTRPDTAYPALSASVQIRPPCSPSLSYLFLPSSTFMAPSVSTRSPASRGSAYSAAMQRFCAGHVCYDCLDASAIFRACRCRVASHSFGSIMRACVHARVYACASACVRACVLCLCGCIGHVPSREMSRGVAHSGEVRLSWYMGIPAHRPSLLSPYVSRAHVNAHACRCGVVASTALSFRCCQRDAALIPSIAVAHKRRMRACVRACVRD